MRAKNSRVVEIFILTKLGIGRGLLIDRRRLVAIVPPADDGGDVRSSCHAEFPLQAVTPSPASSASARRAIARRATCAGCTFSTSGNSKILSTTDASVEFMNSASKVEIKDDKGALLATVDMKDSAAAIRAVVTCVREHPPKSGPVAREPETIISGTGFFVAPNRVVTNNHVVSGCTKDIQVRYPNKRAYTATISGQDATNDLVLLYTDMDNLSIAAFYPRPRVGDQVASYGFPRSDILS